MSTPPPYEKTPMPQFSLNSLYRGGEIDTRGQFIFNEAPALDRRHPTFLELEQPRGTEIIGMNQSGHVVAEPHQKRRIGTYGLGGCTAVGVLATFSDGRRRAYVQHYDAFAKRWDSNLPGSLEEALLSNEAEQGNYSAATRVNSVIMVPGLGYIEPEDPAQVVWLTDTIKRDFGIDTTVTVALYSANIKNGESPYTKALVIDIPAEGSPEIFPGISRIKTEL